MGWGGQDTPDRWNGICKYRGITTHGVFKE